MSRLGAANLALWLTCVAACGPASAPAQAGPESAAAVRVLTFPASSAPVVTLRLLFRSGSADDPPGREGATALLTSLLVEGGTASLTGYQVKQALFPWAASIDAQVDTEMTVLTARIHRDNLAPFLHLLGDILVHPRWDPAELERLRTDAIDGIEKGLRSNDDEALGQEALSGLLYGGHPYGHYVGGTVAGLRAITLDDLRALYATAFNRRRATVGIAGGWPAELPQQIAELLSGLPDGPAPGEVPPAPQPGATRVLLVHKDAPAVAVSMGYPVDFNRSDPDFPALMVALSAFGEHRQFNGRLMQRLREMRGLNYGDYAYAEYFHQEGWSTFAATNIGRSQQFFSIWLRPIENDKALFGVRAALHEYDLLLGAGLTDAEVDTTKRFLAGYTRLWEKNDSRRLGYLLDDDFYGTPNRLEQVRAALPSITTEQVNAAIHKHLQPAAALRIVLVAQDAAKLRDAMVANTPSPITYNSAKPPELLQQDQEIIARPFGVGVEAVRIVEAAELFER